MTQNFRIVLHPALRDGEWITHCENLQDNGERKTPHADFYWGHYFDDYLKAFNDYVARCKRYNLTPKFN